jgi:hypothetical protein
VPIVSGSGSGSGGGLKSLFTSTLSGAAASIDTGAAGIAAGHGTLYVVICGHTSGAGVDVGVNVIVNNDTSSIYDVQQLAANITTVSAGVVQASAQWSLDMIGTNASDSYSSTVILEIPQYDQTTFWKSGAARCYLPYSQSTSLHVMSYAIGYRATTAISRLKATAASGNLVTGTSLTVYGLQ